MPRAVFAALRVKRSDINNDNIVKAEEDEAMRTQAVKRAFERAPWIEGAVSVIGATLLAALLPVARNLLTVRPLRPDRA
jgi:hypothetical protein